MDNYPTLDVLLITNQRGQNRFIDKVSIKASKISSKACITIGCWEIGTVIATQLFIIEEKISKRRDNRRVNDIYYKLINKRAEGFCIGKVGNL